VIVDGERLTEARAEQISEEIMEAVYKHYGMKYVPRNYEVTRTQSTENS
jgi:predicted hydrolase (HD superfamily)